MKHTIPRACLLGLTALLLLPAPALAKDPPEPVVHEDAVPEGAPPGFEEVDVKPEVEAIQRREEEKLRRTAEVEVEMRRMTPERALRARYGSATFDLFAPF